MAIKQGRVWVPMREQLALRLTGFLEEFCRLYQVVLFEIMLVRVQIDRSLDQQLTADTLIEVGHLSVHR